MENIRKTKDNYPVYFESVMNTKIFEYSYLKLPAIICRNASIGENWVTCIEIWGQGIHNIGCVF